jgi:hypothetical protein
MELSPVTASTVGDGYEGFYNPMTTRWRDAADTGGSA